RLLGEASHSLGPVPLPSPPVSSAMPLPVVMSVPLMSRLSTTERPTPFGSSGVEIESVPSATSRLMLTIVLPGGITGDDWAGMLVLNRPRVHSTVYCGAGVVVPFAMELTWLNVNG